MIRIVESWPIILTKDKTWKPPKGPRRPGDILWLPKDAVLVVPKRKKKEEEV